MKRILPTGEQSFVTLRKNNLFYVDKTRFISDWWTGHDRVTLLTRPRRFGKTLMLDTVRTFFSPEFSGRSDLFEGLRVWQDETIRPLQGTIPVIFLSFSDVKSSTCKEAIELIKESIVDLYTEFKEQNGISYILDDEKEQFSSVCRRMSNTTAQTSLRYLSHYLLRQYKTQPIILLDEYDTPLQEAWLKGYWDELVDFIRGLFNSTFKNNPYLERALLTGITRVSKESIFSDMNNIEVVSITSDLYADSLGFTNAEVIAALKEYDLDTIDEVKNWYDGFIFGSLKEIYNPWSIIKYLKHKKFEAYWAETSSNALVGQLLAQANGNVKKNVERLLDGESIVAKLNEQIIFSELYNEEGAIWSLLMAAGYLKPLAIDYVSEIYELTLTNLEVHIILNRLISRWFNKSDGYGKLFREALLADNISYMNKYLSEIAESTFSYFDTGGKKPECFYHAFVLGLIVDLKGRYEIRSNRESGFGRYDIIMLPKKGDHGIIIEFKTIDESKEKNLSESCVTALNQIRKMHYINDLVAGGVQQSNIYVYGFSFKAKELKICGGQFDTIEWNSFEM